MSERKRRYPEAFTAARMWSLYREERLFVALLSWLLGSERIMTARLLPNQSTGL